MSGYEALLIDYGGVLTTSMRCWLDESSAAVGVDTDKFLQAVAALSPSPFALIEAGTITRDEFGDLLTPALVESVVEKGATPTGIEWLSAITISERYLDAAMIARIDDLRARGIRVVLLSNSWGADEYPWSLLPQFDAKIVSGAVGIRKPDLGIYEAALAAAGVPAEKCVFVDDTAENLPPARSLGIEVIHHTDPADTLRQLDNLFGAGSPS